jgi:GTP-binding protein
MHAFSQTRFLAAAGALEDFPAGDRPELAFAGRSNAGKSSAINALAGRRRLAFAAKAPGRTRTINFFDLGAAGRLVDLPGYGFAAVPRALRAHWERLVRGYFEHGRRLAGVVLLMDVRHPLTAQDRELLEWLRPLGARLLVLLSKADKLPRAAARAALAEVRAALEAAAIAAEVMLFSATRSEGVDQARALLESWLADGSGQARAGWAGRDKKPPVKGKATGGKVP